MLRFLRTNVSIEKDRGKVIIFIVFCLFSMCIDVVVTYLNGSFIDQIVKRNNIEQLLNYSVILISGYVMSIVFRYVYGVVSTILREKLSFSLVSKLIEHLHYIPLLELKKYEASYLTERIYSDSSDIINFVLDNGIMFVINGVIGMSLIFYVSITNMRVSVVFICFLPIYILIYVFSGNKLAHKTEQVKESQNIFYQKMYEQISLTENIKVEASFRENDSYIRKIHDIYIKKFLEYTQMNEGIKALENLVSYGFYAVLLVLGVKEIVEGNLTLGEFTVINAYFNRVISIISYYLDFGKNLKQVDVSLKRIQELFDIKSEHNGDIILNEIENIKIKKLSYKYPDSKELILKNINYTFKKNNIYIIRGLNGNGKSTLGKIIVGLLENIDDVYINGYDIRRLDMYMLRKKVISILNQKIQFPYDKIKNIIEEKHYDTIQYLMKEDNFNLKEYLNSYPEELSGGQLQKLYLYKILQEKKQVLILDEPTSALDGQSTKILFKILQKIKKGRIIIIITHDMNFEKIADGILNL